MSKMRLILGGILAAAFLCVMSSHASAAGKYAYVDLSYLFDNFYKTKEYDKVLEDEHNSFEKERNAKIESIREKQGQLGILSADKKAALEEEIEKMKQELLEYDRQNKTDLTKKRNEKIREILLEIEKIVSDYAEREKYEMIFNDRVLIYGSQSQNVTQPILEILNKK